MTAPVTEGDDTTADPVEAAVRQWMLVDALQDDEDTTPEEAQAEQATLDQMVAALTDEQRAEYEAAIGTSDSAMAEPDAFAVDTALDGVPTQVPWHGVLAPEGVLSGDKRKFVAGSLRHRPLPLPLMYQDATAEGHDGAVRVANIQGMTRHDGKVVGWGLMDSSDNAAEATRQIASQMLRGVSVDVDDATFGFEDADGNALTGDLLDLVEDPVMAITDGRVSGATLVSIPAFAEAYVALGPPPEQWGSTARTFSGQFDLGAEEYGWTEAEHPRGKKGTESGGRWVSGQSAQKDKDGKDKAGNTVVTIKKGDTLSGLAREHGTTVDALMKANPKIKNPDLIYAGDDIAIPKDAKKPATKKSAAKPAAKKPAAKTPAAPAAKPAAKKAAAAEGELEHFVDDSGVPGVMPRKLKAYWTHGEGAAKIGWGSPGDFNRCRTNLAEYVPEHMLSGLCANLHHAALGVWPGREAADVETLNVESPDADRAPAMTVGLTASAAQASDYADPGLDGPTPVTVTADGRIYGHLAVFGTCHIGLAGHCVTPPRSSSRYAYFRTGEVICADGSSVSVGHITMGTGHARPTLASGPAMEHYDNTGSVVADVAAGEDAYGIWVSGRVRPGATDAQVETLRASALSGDWRRIGGSMELVAALAVNVPGFPIPRVQTAVQDRRQVTLVASGVVQPVGGVMVAGLSYSDWRRRERRRDRLAAKIGRDKSSRVAAATRVVRGV